MKKVHIWAIAVLALAFGGAIFAAFQFGEKTPVIAAGQIEISPELNIDARELSDLFIVIYDQENPAPMPYGAIRYQLEKPAEGKFFDFVITKDNLQIMQPDLPLPKTLRIKARLDVDGRAGLDQPGDLVGETSNIETGSRSVSVKIDHKT